MPVEINPSQKTFFPFVGGGLQERTEYSFLSSPYPSVAYNSLEVTSNIETTGDTQEETVQIALNFVLEEAVNQFILSNPSTKRWYNTPDFLNHLRLRVIACFGDRNSRILDYSTQRMNEYQAGIMSISGPSSVSQFIAGLRAVAGDVDYSLFTPLGPFGADELLDIFKRGNNDKLYYDPNSTSPLSDIVVHDVPVRDLLKRTSQGAFVLEPQTPPLPKNMTAPNAADLQDFFLQKIVLDPITFSFGKGETFTDTRLSEIKFYSFTYMDQASYLESKGKRKKAGRPGKISQLLKTGMGFITPGVFRGNQYIFRDQENSSIVTPDKVKEQATAPLARNIRDQRGLSDVKLYNVKDNLYTNFEKSLKSLGANAKVSEIIKNDNYFSSFWVTKCENDNARYGFAFDKLSFLVENSDFSGLYTSPQIVEDLFNGGGLLDVQENEQVKILDISMSKRQVKEHRTVGVNELTYGRGDTQEVTYFRPEETVPSPTLVEGMQLSLNQSIIPRFGFYEGYDTYEEELKTQTQGTFQYGVSAVVVDPAILYLRKMSVRLSEIENEARAIYQLIINSPPTAEGDPVPSGLIRNGVGLYDSNNDEKIFPLGKIAVNNTTAEQVLSENINTFVELYYRIAFNSDISFGSLVRFLDGMVSRPSPHGIDEFADIVANLKRSIDAALSSHLPRDPFGEGTTSRSKVGQSNSQEKVILLKTQKYFDEFFEFGQDYGAGYLYLSRLPAGDIENQNGLPTYSRNLFSQRRQEEFNKYFTTYTEAVSTSVIVDPAGTTYDDSSYQYFTPKGIKIFGRETLVQTDYKAAGQNIVDYDLNKYGELFSDIIKRKNISIDQHIPFYSLPIGQPEPREIFNSLNDSLRLHSCQITEGTNKQFSVPNPSNVSPKVIKVGQEGHEKDDKKGPAAIATILGGGSDTEASTKKFLKDADTELGPNATSTYGAVNDPSFKNPDVEGLPNQALPPTKLIFGIIGEMELNPHIDEVSYQKETFNSMVNNVTDLGIDTQSIKASIDNLYRNIPNQYKSMFVLAASQAKESFGSGFDAVRVFLRDKDVASFEEAISYISEGEDFPPYASTRDPMKIYSKFLAFWMNYKQIGVIEYLAGFGDLDVSSFADRGIDTSLADASFTSKPLLPVWQKFTADLYNRTQGQDMFCRVRTLTADDVRGQAAGDQNGKANKGVEVGYKDLFDLPIYNRYFMLRGQ